MGATQMKKAPTEVQDTSKQCSDDLSSKCCAWWQLRVCKTQEFQHNRHNNKKPILTLGNFEVAH